MSPRELEPRGVLFTQSLNWLRKALKLEEVEMPQHFSYPQVLGIVDVLQSGYAIAGDMRGAELTIPALSGAAEAALIGPANITPVITLAQDEQAVVIGSRTNHTGGAANLLCQYNVWSRSGATTKPGRFDVPINTTASHREVFGTSDALIFIPANCSLRFQHPATAAGETLTAVVHCFVMPAGFRPW
jgi:hypothetical protein